VYEEHNIRIHELHTTGAVRMGVLTGDDRFLKGRISCMQVYNKALTEREVYAVRGLCFQKGLFEAVSTNLIDRSFLAFIALPHERDLTLEVNNPVYLPMMNTQFNINQ